MPHPPEIIRSLFRLSISYSHKDIGWLNRLKVFLKPLEDKAELAFWVDTDDIQLGAQWEAEIRKSIANSDAAILLISANFLASEYIKEKELPPLLQAAQTRGLRVFPVFVSFCFLPDDHPLLKFQAANDPQNPLDTLAEPEQNRIFANLAKSIFEILNKGVANISEEWLEKFRSRFEPVLGGKFTFGDNELYQKAHSLPEREIEVASFRLGKYVVTQSEWIAIMNTQPWLSEENVMLGDDIPAVNVSWHQATDFGREISRKDTKYTYRLPTEVEWEYAARGGKDGVNAGHTKYCFGNDKSRLEQYGWYNANVSRTQAQKVGILKPNQLKLYDMHGNIWEWTTNIDDNELLVPVLRGGGFNYDAEGASSAYRISANREHKGVAIGFRLVQEPK